MPGAIISDDSILAMPMAIVGDDSISVIETVNHYGIDDPKHHASGG